MSPFDISNSRILSANSKMSFFSVRIKLINFGGNFWDHQSPVNFADAEVSDGTDWGDERSCHEAYFSL